MLSGIGGRTIAEAQMRISHQEFVRWAQYRRKRGSLNIGLRFERGAALLATMYANTHKGKNTASYQFHDFAPHHDVPALTLEQAMASWG